MTKQTDNQSKISEKTMSKMEQYSFVADKSNLARKKVSEVVDIFEGLISSLLKEGHSVSFMGMKIYTVIKEATPERDVMNPFTKVMMRLPAKPKHRVVRVKPLKKLKDMVN